MSIIERIYDALKEHSEITVTSSREDFSDLVHTLQENNILWGIDHIAKDNDIEQYKLEHDPPGVNIIDRRKHNGNVYFWFLDYGHHIRPCNIDYTEPTPVVIDSDAIMKLLGGIEHG